MTSTCRFIHSEKVVQAADEFPMRLKIRILNHLLIGPTHLTFAVNTESDALLTSLDTP